MFEQLEKLVAQMKELIKNIASSHKPMNKEGTDIYWNEANEMVIKDPNKVELSEIQADPNAPLKDKEGPEVFYNESGELVTKDPKSIDLSEIAADPNYVPKEKDGPSVFYNESGELVTKDPNKIELSEIQPKKKTKK